MKNRNKYHAQSQKQAYLFLAPSMLILTVFVFIPLIGALVISVMNIDIYMNNISFAGFGNYLKMFHDSRIGNATFNSFYFALAEVPLQVFMALLMLMSVSYTPLISLTLSSFKSANELPFGHI